MNNKLDSLLFIRLFVPQASQIAFIAEEKSPSRISLRDSSDAKASAEWRLV